MEKKRSTGVTVFAWYFMITSVAGFLSNIYLLKNPSSIHTVLQTETQIYKGSAESLELVSLISLGLNILVFFIGFNILRLKELWRKITIYYCLFMILYAIVYLSNLKINLLAAIIIFYIAIIFFFSRREVKQQFMQQDILQNKT